MSDLPRDVSNARNSVVGRAKSTGDWYPVDSSADEETLEFWREHHNPEVWTEFKLARRIETVAWAELDD